MRFPRITFLFVGVLLCILCAFRALAQSPNGNINGLVLDPSNRVIAGAEIIAVNDITNVQFTTKTNNDGVYVLPNLPPGPYRLQVSRVGFKTVIKPDIVLNIQDALSINFTLPMGAVFEVMTVEGGASVVNTESASVSTVVDSTYVANMPLNGRSFQDLILLTPGSVTQSPQNTNAQLGETGEFSVNGQRPESNYYTVDGVSANVGAAPGAFMLEWGGASGSVPAATALGTTQGLVSVDDLQEFRVQSSTYSAEYGRNPGGQFAFETKSGTNQWHGTAYDYLRNGAFDAKDWFNDYFGLPGPTIRQNDFGGTFGGPVEVPGLHQGKEQTFFFVSYEGLRLIAPQADSVNPVPDLCLRGVVASCTGTDTPAPTALQPILNAFPLPSANGIVDTANGSAQYIGSWSNPSSINSTSIRFDHVVNDKLRLFFRFSDTGSSAANRGTFALAGTPAQYQTLTYTTRTYTAGAGSIISNTLSNDLRFNYSSNVTISSQFIKALGGSSPVDFQQLTGLGAGSYVGADFVNLENIAIVQRQASGAQRQWNLVDTLTRSLGHHQFRFGADYRRLAPFALPENPEILYYYFSKSAVQTNSANTVAAAQAPAYPLYTNFSAFAQDDWRVSLRLSVSLGLRWEVNPAPGVTQGLKPYTVQGAGPNTWTLAPQGTRLWQTTYGNFAPRLGAAYILRNTSGWETVVRGGVGVFYDSGQQLGSLGFSGPGFMALSVNFVTTTPFPTLPALPTIVNPPVAPLSNVAGFEPHLQLPYSLQWNASIEQALSKSQALTISYVGSHGSRLLQENFFEPANNPVSSSFYFVENGLTSDYDSLQIQFRRRLSRGLTALASYTWSHCLDYGSQNYALAYRRGSCDFDVRHNLSVASSYDLPDVGHSGFVNAVLHHWGLDDRFTARTAFPVTLNGNPLLQPNGQQYFGGLNFVSGQPVYL